MAVSTPFGCLGDTLHESLRQQVGIACFGLASWVRLAGQTMLSFGLAGLVTLFLAFERRMHLGQ
jgi:hypothetical protein